MLITMRPKDDDLTTGLVRLANDIPKNSIMAEIGCYAGESTAIFAARASIVFAVDPWIDYTVLSHTNPGERVPIYAEEAEKEFDKVVELYPHIKKMKGTSKQVSLLMPDKILDAVYIDGVHEYDSVVEDIKLWLPKIKKNGIISGHDYTHMVDIQRAVNDAIGGPDAIYPDSSWIKWLKS